MGLFAKKKAQENGPLRIFIVEDSKTYALQLQHRIVSKFGHAADVSIFPVSETVDIKLENKLFPDVIILDNFLNTRYDDAESGTASIDRLFQLSPDSRIILHSAGQAPEALPENVKFIPKSESGIQEILDLLQQLA